ncbi:uncharacterized protein LOC105213082 isoform X2 [Zeugodacus cucurbitae]|uniref:uncharacterized protein LOC105213082 isoform X2 n=1 Tax=Zeugodacus cucurbitae TaxID=28588 RepID=UPI0023D93EED|nr:uncharacterized protein LOC105213082 isoform X2 [Zeugodacus cucurbitae]
MNNPTTQEQITYLCKSLCGPSSVNPFVSMLSSAELTTTETSCPVARNREFLSYTRRRICKMCAPKTMQFGILLEKNARPSWRFHTFRKVNVEMMKGKIWSVAQALSRRHIQCQHVADVR